MRSGWGALLQLAVEHDGEVGVQPLVAADQLVGEAQAGQLAVLAVLDPVDRAEGGAEEDALHAGECDQALGQRPLAGEPGQGPLRLLPDHRHGLDRAEEVALGLLVGDVGVDQQRVGLGVDGLDQHLHRIVGPRLRRLDLAVEARGQVLVHDAVGGGEERQHVQQEVLLIAAELAPVLLVLGQIDLLGGPHQREMVLVGCPQLAVADREHHEAVEGLRHQGILEAGEQRGEIAVGSDLGGILDACSAAPFAVEHEASGGLVLAGAHQGQLDQVLDLLQIEAAARGAAPHQVVADPAGEQGAGRAAAGGQLAAIGGGQGLADGVGDAFRLEGAEQLIARDHRPLGVVGRVES